MKKLILLICISFSLNAGAQAPKKPAADTAKAQPNYFLIGLLPDFKLLFSAVATPGDITPNQKTALLDWINKGLTEIKADTLSKKK